MARRLAVAVAVAVAEKAAMTRHNGHNYDLSRTYDLGWDQPHLDGHRVELAVASLQD